jgi:hypothetical protein
VLQMLLEHGFGMGREQVELTWCGVRHEYPRTDLVDHSKPMKPEKH